MAYTYDTLHIGTSFHWSRTLSQSDIRDFADVTGDDNPLHVDPEYAAKTRFEQPIAHGVFLLALFSKVLGHDFPGPGAIAVSISVKFLRPVIADSKVEIEARVTEKIERYKHVKLRMHAYVGGKLVVGGDCIIVPPEWP